MSTGQRGPAKDKNQSRNSRWLWFDRVFCCALAIYGVVVLMTLLAAPHFKLGQHDAVGPPQSIALEKSHQDGLKVREFGPRQRFLSIDGGRW